MQSGAGYSIGTPLTPHPKAGGGPALFHAEDGLPSLRDVIDTLNPLEHIPFVSTLYDEFTGHTPAAASKLAGGALLGGVFGFATTLANVIFEGVTGKDVGETVLAALGMDGEEAPVQVASADTVDANAAYQTAARDVPGQEILPPEMASIATAAPVEPMILASAETTMSPIDSKVLDLYGGSTSASRAYQRAQMRPYLQEASHSVVL